LSSKFPIESAPASHSAGSFPGIRFQSARLALREERGRPKRSSRNSSRSTPPTAPAGAHVDDLIESQKQRSFWPSSRGLLIAFAHFDDPPSGNHESLESKILKRKKARPSTRPSCKNEYFIETTSAYVSGRSAFITDDSIEPPQCCAPSFLFKHPLRNPIDL
jgi:hypothetical protein